jgi:hypothetical protein
LDEILKKKDPEDFIRLPKLLNINNLCFKYLGDLVHTEEFLYILFYSLIKVFDKSIKATIILQN